MTTIKYMTKGDLVRINDQAIEMNLNRHISPEYVGNLNRKLRFPITETWAHNDHIRAKVILDIKGNSSYLDMSWEDYNKLPTFVTDAV